MKVRFTLSYIILGVSHMIAISAGMETWTELPWALCIFIAALVCFTPIINTTLAMLGSVAAWHWSWAAAASVFLLPMVIYFISAIVVYRHLGQIEEMDDTQSDF
ncbi:MAG: hypothetical protein CMK89_12475 [Pseudomonadales bacterium]|nr:hypothetical protein [Pseudomonadales bacterium]